MHTFLMFVAVLAAACVALLVLIWTHTAIKRYCGTARSGLIRESASLSAGCFAVLTTVSVGAIYLAGAACRMDTTQVQSVDRGSMAATVGIIPGDIITHVNGRPVSSLYDVLRHFSVKSDLTLSVLRGRHSSSLLIPASLLNAGPIPDNYGLHFPILVTPISASDAFRKWLNVAAWMLGPILKLEATMPQFLVGVRFQDTFACLLAILSVSLPFAAPLLVVYRRLLFREAPPVIEPAIARGNVCA